MRLNSLDDIINELQTNLLAKRNKEGFWEGRLSSSAISTAIAGLALHYYDSRNYRECIMQAKDWLLNNQNTDGGWGDTDRSCSNYPATTLVVAFLTALGEKNSQAYKKGLSYINASGGVANIIHYYGDDFTFSIPIMMTCAIAGLIHWKHIPHLPFEAILMPRKLLKLFKIQVVSYALPALCAVGLLLEYKNPTGGFRGFMRRLARAKALRLIEKFQPTSGGYLEAIPLTGFVLLALSELNLRSTTPARKAAEFLKKARRVNGSWPIDENLSVWITSLALSALHAAEQNFNSSNFEPTKKWYLALQSKSHIYTDSPAGGFPWTHLPGGVPDADDTGIVLKVLPLLGLPKDNSTIKAAIAWCRKLQNSDGGWPTFCKGWGKLPFDRSSVDVTSHVLLGLYSVGIRKNSKVVRRGLTYLLNNQLEDGSFKALWFGNELELNKNNYIYATSQAARVFALYKNYPKVESALRKAIDWVLKNQNDDGGWGAAKGIPSSPEETAFGILGLAAEPTTKCIKPIKRAIAWLLRHREKNGCWPASPIGLYFAQLWYYEETYSLIFPLWALAEARRVIKELKNGS